MSKYDGTGPSGGWDIKGMAEEIARLNLCLDHDNARLILLEKKIEELEQKLESQALIAPGSFGGYIPRNRKI